MRESTIENAVCKYAKNNDWLVYKFVSPSNRGVPDRIFIKKYIVFFIEFKTTGKKLRKLQEKIISDIRKENVEVYVVDNIDFGKQIINKYMKLINKNVINTAKVKVLK